MNKFFVDQNINELIEILTKQLSLQLEHLHFKYHNYESILCNLDLKNSRFLWFYNKFIEEHIKNKIPDTRIVYNNEPSIVCSLPNKKTYHELNHPLEKNGFSIFVPFTKWFECNTISVATNDSVITCDGNKYDIYMIPSDSKVSIPSHTNITNNTSLGITCFVMSYQNYKNSKLFLSKKIGDFFSLI